MDLGVVVPGSIDLDLVRDPVNAHRRLAAALERRGHRDDLGRAARLEDVRHRDVRGRRHALGVGRVEFRPLGHREDLPGLRVHDHYGAVRGVGQPDPLLAGLLSFPLQVGLDRQAQILGRHLRMDIVLGERDGLAPRAGLDVFLAVLAGQQRVVSVLDAGRTVQLAGFLVRVGEAEQVGGEVAVGVDAAVTRGLVDAGQVEAGDAAAGRRGDAGLQRDVVRRRAVLVDQRQDPGMAASRAGLSQRGGDCGPLRRGQSAPGRRRSRRSARSWPAPCRRWW